MFNKYTITKLGEYLTKKSINKAEFSRRTGISKSRLSKLSTNIKIKLRAEELYLIVLPIDMNPCKIFEGIELSKKKQKTTAPNKVQNGYSR